MMAATVLFLVMVKGVHDMPGCPASGIQCFAEDRDQALEYARYSLGLAELPEGSVALPVSRLSDMRAVGVAA